MRELSLQTWCCTKEMERPDNIFFKKQQSQTRKRARKAPNDGSGCVVCFAFITTNLRCSQRHYYFFLETKMATRNDGRWLFSWMRRGVGQKTQFVVSFHPPLASSNDLVLLSSLRVSTQIFWAQCEDDRKYLHIMKLLNTFLYLFDFQNITKSVIGRRNDEAIF